MRTTKLILIFFLLISCKGQEKGIIITQAESSFPVKIGISAKQLESTADSISVKFLIPQKITIKNTTYSILKLSHFSYIRLKEPINPIVLSDIDKYGNTSFLSSGNKIPRKQSITLDIYLSIYLSKLSKNDYNMIKGKMKESGKTTNLQLYDIGSLEENREFLKRITKIDSETEYIRVYTHTKDKNFVEDINVNL